MENKNKSYVAFIGTTRIARGTFVEIATAAKEHHDKESSERLALFDTSTGRPFDLDLRGTLEEVIECLVSHPLFDGSVKTNEKRGPGRPKLGVVSREISLLPRHWSWLSEQRGGASATLRRVVDEARNSNATEDKTRRALDAAHNFMWDIAGDQANFEDASRALFSKDFEGFEQQTMEWPVDIRDELQRILGQAREA
ncbi:MAG: hypothetical protein ACI8X5_002523 [Planctomycetota bacterium]|jgi:hypothetical protein